METGHRAAVTLQKGACIPSLVRTSQSFLPAPTRPGRPRRTSMCTVGLPPPRLPGGLGQLRARAALLLTVVYGPVTCSGFRLPPLPCWALLPNVLPLHGPGRHPDARHEGARPAAQTPAVFQGPASVGPT